MQELQRQIRHSVLGLEREAMRLDREENSMRSALTKLGKENKMDQATSKAKEMVRLRAHRARIYRMRENMSGLGQQLQTVQGSQRIQETVALTCKMLHGLNARFDASSVARMLAEFEKQNALFANKQEIIDDTLDQAFEVDGELDATSEAVLEVLEEAGLDVRSRMGEASAGRNEPVDADLEARLQKLREG